MARTLAALAIALFTAAPVAAQVTWTFRGPTGPIARIEQGMVYDAGNRRMLTFGGFDLNFNRTNDVWEYDGVTRIWTDVTAPGPGPRNGMGMDYDPIRRRVLVFGGADEAANELGETWQWDTVAKTWTQLFPSPSPPARVGTRLAYDAANDRFVLYGGWNIATGVIFSDTWAWSPVTGAWTNLNPGNSSPTGRPFSPRAYHGFVYNTSNNRVTIFGGIGAGFDMNDLWELQGNTWVDVTPAGTLPPTRCCMSAVYEQGNGRLVIYAGLNHAGQFDYIDTWAWNGSSWSQLPNGPTGRDSHVMVWDRDRGLSIMFGGFLADVWELTGSTWTGPFNDIRWPPADDEHSIAYDPIPVNGHRRIFLYGGGHPHVWETFHFGNNTGTLRWRFPWLFPPGTTAPPGGGRIGHAMVWETPRDRLLFFGGRERFMGVLGPTVFGDTWAFTRTPGVANAAWTLLSGSGPPARYDHAMVYDALRDRTILFGGRNAAGAPLGDTWIWNGSSWSPGPAGPSARFDHAMAYDAARGVIVLFGGQTGAQKLGDTWEWNGSAWALRATTGPAARSGVALSDFGSPCGGVLLFGGRTAAGTLQQDHWLWNGSSWTPGSAGAAQPSAREKARMVWDPAEGRLWLFGGMTAIARSGEMWTATVGGGAAAFSINDVTLAEGNAGTTAANFTVTLAPVQAAGASVAFSTANGTAAAGSDYLPNAGTLAFSACQGSAVVTVPVIGDPADEPDESFFVNLASPSGATIADGQGLGTILDEDPTPAVVVEDCAVAEGNAPGQSCVFRFTLSHPSASVVSFNYATANGTATAGLDYTPATGTTTFPALTTGPQTLAVAVLGDTSVEGDESFVLNLSAVVAATLPDPQGDGTILDDDTPALAGFELSHGSRLTADLAADPGPAPDVDVYRLAQAPRASYEVVLDAVSGDVAPQVVLERLASNNVTVLQTAAPVGTGSSKSLRWENLVPAQLTTQALRLRGAGCGANCGADDVYRLRSYETTYSIPRLNNAGGQVTVLVLQNPASYTINGHAWFWDAAGALLHSQPFTLAPRAVMAFNTASAAALVGKGGTITISNDGRYGDLVGKGIALEPATGFSFDSPMVPRPRPYF